MHALDDKTRAAVEMAWKKGWFSHNPNAKTMADYLIEQDATGNRRRSVARANKRAMKRKRGSV